MKLFFNIPDTILVEQGDQVVIRLNSTTSDGVIIETNQYARRIEYCQRIEELNKIRISVDVDCLFFKLNTGEEKDFICILEAKYTDSLSGRDLEEMSHKLDVYFPDESLVELGCKITSEDVRDIEYDEDELSERFRIVLDFEEDVVADFYDKPEPVDPSKDGIEFLLYSADFILELAVKMNSTSSEIESLNNYLKEVEIAEMEKVTNEEDANGKPLYSNDTKRQIELKKRLAEDEEYNTNKDKLKELQERLKEDSIQMQYLRDKQNNLRVLLPLISNS